MKGESLCEGDLIAFCDQDDVWLDTKLARCREEFLRNQDVRLVVHSNDVVDGQLQPTGKKHPRLRRSYSAPSLQAVGERFAVAQGAAMVFSAELLPLADYRARPLSSHLAQRIYHDEWIYFLASVTGTIVFLKETLGLYRRHDENVSGGELYTLRTRIRTALTTTSSLYAGQARQALEFVELSQRLATENGDASNGRFTRAADFYHSLGRTLELRAAMYEPNVALRIRLTRLGQLARSHAYRNRTLGGFGARALLKDVTHAVVGSSGRAWLGRVLTPLLRE